MFWYLLHFVLSYSKESQKKQWISGLQIIHECVCGKNGEKRMMCVYMESIWRRGLMAASWCKLAPHTPGALCMMMFVITV